MFSRKGSRWQSRSAGRLFASALTSFLLLMALPAAASAFEKGAVPDVTWGTSRAEIDRTVSLLQESDVRWVRTNVAWNAGEENGKGNFNGGYFADIDYAIGKVRAAGIDVIMPVADGVPYWASADPSKHTDSSGKHWTKEYRPANVNDYADFVRYVVNRYKSHGVHIFEVWNEPNHSRFWPSGPNASQYVQMLQAGYGAIKQADPSATVLLGGLAGNDHAYLKQVYSAGGGPYFDAVSVHPYTSTDPTTCWNDGSGTKAKDAFCGIEAVRDTMTANGDAAKGVWVTEIGWATYSGEYGVSESQQADYLTKAFTKLEGYGWVKAALWYNLRNNFWAHDANTWEDSLGLLRTNFSPKPAYSAFKDYVPGRSSSQGAPTVTLRAPTRGATFSSRLTISASATDDSGVAKVEFWVGKKLVNVDRAAPYTYTWRPKHSPFGSHEVRAKAFDGSGLSAGDSATVKRLRRTSTTLRVSGAGAVAASASKPRRSPRLQGRVKGARAGVVVIRLERLKAGGWTRAKSFKVKLRRDGRFARKLARSLRGGKWRSSARYAGSRGHAPSSSRFSHFRVS